MRKICIQRDHNSKKKSAISYILAYAARFKFNSVHEYNPRDLMSYNTKPHSQINVMKLIKI